MTHEHHDCHCFDWMKERTIVDCFNELAGVMLRARPFNCCVRASTVFCNPDSPPQRGMMLVVTPEYGVVPSEASLEKCLDELRMQVIYAPHDKQRVTLGARDLTAYALLHLTVLSESAQVP